MEKENRSFSLTVVLILLFSNLNIFAQASSPPLQSHRAKTGTIRPEGAGLQQGYGAGSSEKILEVPSPKYKLNDTFIPSRYFVDLAVILDNDLGLGDQFTVPGKVSITGKSLVNANNLTLHSYLLQINAGSIKIEDLSDPSNFIGVDSVTNATDPGLHFFTISLNTTINAGSEYEIYIEFTAPVSSDRRNGLYLSTYVDPENGEERRQAVTQFESVYARQLFPCFDEPHLKAEFDVIIHRKNNYTSLANGHLLQTLPDPERLGWSIDIFNTTMPMSTYLFAIVVSDFISVQTEVDRNGRQINVTIHGPKHVMERGDVDYSLTFTAQVLNFFDDYFNTSFPFDKIDSIAVPLKGGAMENWGLVLYRTDLLIYFPDETTEFERSTLTNTISHELAHQNFGNLVTCKWWSILWLNEGFATYLSYLGVDALYPEFFAREQILNEAFQFSMIFDGGSNSHPMSGDVLTPPEIDSIFSRVTYEKAGSVIRMIEGFLSPETLQKGLRYYLKEMEFKPVEQDDLIRNLDKAAVEDSRLPLGPSVKDILDSWTLQKGFPVVTVKSGESSETVLISQESFRNDSSASWYVPITIVTSRNPSLQNNTAEFWLTPAYPATLYEHPHRDGSSWIMLNYNASGYYRVMYCATLLDMISKQLVANSSVISPLSRSQLLDDYFAFAASGRVGISVPLTLTHYTMDQEDHFTVWDVIFTNLKKPHDLFQGEAAEDLKNYLLPRIESTLVKVGLKQNPRHIGTLGIFREHLFDWACSLGGETCRDYAAELFVQLQTNALINPIPVDLRLVMYCAVVSYQGRAGFDLIASLYKDEPEGSAQKFLLLNALPCATESDILIELLLSTLNDSLTSNVEEKLWLIQQTAANDVGRPLILGFLKSRLQQIISQLGAGSPSPISFIFMALSNYVSTQVELDELEQFYKENAETLAPVDAAIQAALGTMKQNIEWMETVGKETEEWLIEETLGSSGFNIKINYFAISVLSTSVLFFGRFYQ